MSKESPVMTFIRWTFGPSFRFLYQPRVTNQKILSRYKTGAVIIAGNHISALDAAFMGALMPRNLHFLAKVELSGKKIGWLSKRLGLIFVDRDIKNNGVDNAVKFLNQGMGVGIFPEGTCDKKFKKKNELLPFKFGAVKMAMATGAPIIPMAISGKYRPFSRRRLVIRYGQPIYLKKDENLETANENLRDAIYELLKKDGVKAVKLAGRPAKNPSKAPPILDKTDSAKTQSVIKRSKRKSTNGKES